MAATKEEIIEAIKEMPALELSELVHELAPSPLPLPPQLALLPPRRRRRPTSTLS